MWEIIQQETKKGMVNVKQVRYYPIKDKKTNEVKGFGRLGMSCYRLLFRHQQNKDYEQWMVTHTRHGYNITCPKRIVEVNRWTKETAMVPGRAFGGESTSGSLTDRAFQSELTKLCGVEFTNLVIDSFKRVA